MARASGLFLMLWIVWTALTVGQASVPTMAVGAVVAALAALAALRCGLAPDQTFGAVSALARSAAWFPPRFTGWLRALCAMGRGALVRVRLADEAGVETLSAIGRLPGAVVVRTEPSAALVHVLDEAKFTAEALGAAAGRGRVAVSESAP